MAVMTSPQRTKATVFFLWYEGILVNWDRSTDSGGWSGCMMLAFAGGRGSDFIAPSSLRCRAAGKSDSAASTK